jgi:ribosomal protein L35
VHEQTTELQTQISTLTAQLKEESANWRLQLEKKDTEFQRKRNAHQLADERAEEHVKAM